MMNIEKYISVDPKVISMQKKWGKYIGVGFIVSLIGLMLSLFAPFYAVFIFGAGCSITSVSIMFFLFMAFPENFNLRRVGKK